MSKIPDVDNNREDVDKLENTYIYIHIYIYIYMYIYISFAKHFRQISRKDENVLNFYLLFFLIYLYCYCCY